MSKPLVVHVTPHLPGGLARILHSTLKFSKSKLSKHHHEIIVTDPKHFSNQAKKIFKNYHKLIHVTHNNSSIRKKLIEADIIQIEYWNHPLVYKFLTTFDIPPARIILCSHTNGFSRPGVITRNALDFCDIFLSTTKATAKHKLIKNTKNYKKFRHINYPIDIQRFGKITKKKHKGFNISYIGTLDYSKLHPNFLKMSNFNEIPNSSILVCGDGFHSKIMKREAKLINKKFKFLGFVENIKKILEITDILGYPLNKRHYGTGEQIILEAMYSKIPVVAFKNVAEKEIIQNNKTGILVNDEKEYKKQIINLYKSKLKRKKIGISANKYVIKNLSPKVSFKKLDSIYNELLKINKKPRKFKNYLSWKLEKRNLGAKLFIESLGEKGNEFKKSFKNYGKKINYKINKKIANIEREMITVTKGSIFQYLYFFPNDSFLNFWVGLISLKNKKILLEKHRSIPKNSKECFKRSLKNKKSYEFNHYLKLIS